MSDDSKTTNNTVRELTPEEVEQVSGAHDWVYYMDVTTAVIALTLALRG